MKKIILLTLCLGFISSCGGNTASSTITIQGAGSSGDAARIFGAQDPTSLRLKVYKFAVSASGDCSNPITVYEDDDPEYTNFLGNPTLGTGSLANNTYPCIMFEFSDNIKFTPTSTDDDCVSGQEETIDVCRDNGSGATPYTLIDGTEGSCDASGIEEERVAMYISTFSTSSGGGGGSNVFAAPTSSSDATNGINLGSPFIVSADKAAIFVVDGTGQVQDGTDECEMQPPAFSFAD